MATSNTAAQPKLSKGLKITLIAVLVGAALYAVLVLRPMLAGPAESAESAPTTTERSDDDARGSSDSDRRSTTTTTKGSGSSGSGSSSGGKSAGAQPDVVVPNRGLDLPPDLAALPERNPMRPG